VPDVADADDDAEVGVAPLHDKCICSSSNRLLSSSAAVRGV
jgi:hypothetical protein